MVHTAVIMIHEKHAEFLQIKPLHKKRGFSWFSSVSVIELWDIAFKEVITAFVKIHFNERLYTAVNCAVFSN
jgi:hypothetical protein